jgi:cytochrome c oxidase subunit 2
LRSWVEAVLAISVTAILGVSLFFFTGEPLIDETTTETTVPITVDGQSAARGEILATDSGCIACHSADGTPGTGPTWKGVAGATRPLDTGESVTADDLYLFRSITDPGAQIVAGYDNVMPSTFGDSLSDQEISDLAEYIKSLG